VLEQEGLASPGFGSVADITACPGTDTCNLGISNSTGISKVLSEVIEEEYPEFLYNKDIAIKISGCMNSCGQHGMASIGFHGSSLKSKGQVLPALQVLIGGGVLGSGDGSIADKVIKVPSKRGPDVLRSLLGDYQNNGQNGESYVQYTKRQGEKYFYDLLKPHASLETLIAEDYIDWGEKEKYATAIGVGECAGVMIDLVATLILEGEEKLEWSQECIDKKAYADGIYNAYAAFVHSAKALLLQYGVQCNTQAGILKDFDTHFTQKGLFTEFGSFRDTVLQMNEMEPSEEFANIYLQKAKEFIGHARQYREQAVLAEKEA
jgi:sulfite reductase (ferredoxin)